MKTVAVFLRELRSKFSGNASLQKAMDAFGAEGGWQTVKDSDPLDLEWVLSFSHQTLLYLVSNGSGIHPVHSAITLDLIMSQYQDFLTHIEVEGLPYCDVTIDDEGYKQLLQLQPEVIRSFLTGNIGMSVFSEYCMPKHRKLVREGLTRNGLRTYFQLWIQSRSSTIHKN